MKAERNRPGQGSNTRNTEQEPVKDKGRQRMLPERSSAWDPFEVWKTRVKSSPGSKGAE